MFSAATKSGKNPTGGGTTTDPQFNYVTALLHGDGTNGAQNNTFLDSSTNNFTITRGGNTTQGSLSPYGANWSNYFDGTGDYLNTTISALGTNNFTIEFWFYVTKTGVTQIIFDLRTPDTTNAGFDIYISSSNVLNVTTSGFFYITGTTTIVANKWYHCALIRSSLSVIQLYTNGVQDGPNSTYAGSSQNFTNTSLRVGYGAGAGYLQGYVSNLRVVNNTALYTSSFTPPTSPLTAVSNTSLLTCQSNWFVDNSPNVFTVTKNGDTSVQRFNPFSPATQTPQSYSGYFDGTGDYLTCSATVPATGTFTVEMWVYPTVTNTFQILFSQYIASNAGNFQIVWSDSLVRKFTVVVGATTVLTSTNTFALNAWYHVAVTRNSSNGMTLWVNGVSEATGTNSTSILQTSTYVGTRAALDGYYNGYISNLRVNNTAVYTTAFTPSTTPLTAITGTTLLTCQSSTFIDNSTNAFTITANGDAKPRAYNPFGFTTALTTGYSTAVNGGSAYFDGSGDYLTAASNAAFGFGTGDFTVEGWFNFTGTIGTYQRPWWFGDDNDNLELNTSVLKVGGATQGTLITGTTTILANQWYHIALTRASGVYKLWLNGVQQGSSATNSYNSSARTFTSMATSGAANPATGYVSNFRIVKGTAVYKSAFVPPLSPVTAITNTQLLLNGTNGGIYDNAMMNDYETVGNAQVSTTIKKYGTGSMFFDGTGDWLVAQSNAIYAFNTGNFTVECWLYINSLPTGVAGIVDTGLTVNANRFSLVLYSSGKIYIDNNTNLLISTSTLSTGQWYHIAAVRNGTGTNQTALYINGIQDKTATIATNFTDTNCRIGGTIDGFSLNGYIDDLRITKGYARYTANFTPPTAAFPNS